MTYLIERLQELQVQDAMSRAVVEVEASACLAEAARTLVAHEITGAPAVNEQRRCVGILSAFDFVRYHADRCAESTTLLAGVPHDVQSSGALQSKPHAGDVVSEYMSPAVQTIAPEASLLQAAREMCATHVHRLPVLDAGGRPLGMITSLDIVAALVNATDEEVNVG
ncbi:MAG: CBS domain-containing protein [Pirellulales bacterium]|nr:CBS domain-containing protein [Pirellulales bacterium]